MALEIIEDETVKADRIGSLDPEIVNWKPPSHVTLKTIRRVTQIEFWIRDQHRIVFAEEILRYAMLQFGITRQNAQQHLKKVVEDFERLDILVIKP